MFLCLHPAVHVDFFACSGKISQVLEDLGLGDVMLLSPFRKASYIAYRNLHNHFFFVAASCDFIVASCNV